MIKEKTIAENTSNYFRVLANSRASLTQLRIALIVVWIPAMFSYGLSQYPHLESNPEAQRLFIISNVLLGCFIVIGIFSLLKRVVFRFQFLSSIILVFLLLVSTVLVDGVAFLIATADNNVILAKPFLSSLYARGIFYLLPATFVLSIIANIVLLRYHLKAGFSDTRTNKIFSAILKAHGSKILGILFVAVMIVPSILTRGRYSMNTFGILCGVSFNAISPNSVVEFSYLAYLKTKDRTYLEKKPRLKAKTPFEKRKLKSKLLIGGYVIFSVLFFYLLDTIYGNRPYPIAIRMIGLLILSSYVVLIIVWLTTKIKKVRKK